MKICDSCRTSYPGEFTICPKDQSPLHTIGELSAGIVLRGKYELVSKLGAGGMGAVYKARHLAFGEFRALKIISAHLLADEGFVGRFKSEAIVTRKLQHPNIVRVEDLDTTEDGQPFIVMEFVEGESLRALIHRTGPLGAARALDLAAQGCLALSVAHEMGVLHRDIKPDNILIVTDADGRETAKVLDFGLAKVLSGFKGATQQMATSTGIMMGTPHYMAPEQALAQKGLDGRVDVYAMGVVLYEMLTGNVPFDSDTPMGIVYQHIQAVPVPPGEAFPDLGIPSAVSALVMKAMEKDPANRFASAAAMQVALTTLAQGLPATAAPAPRAGASVVARTAERLPGAPSSGAMPTVPPRQAPPPTAPPPRATAPGAARTAPRSVPGSPTRVQGGVARTTMVEDDEESRSSWGLVGWIAAGVVALLVSIYWLRSSGSAPPPSPSSAAGGGPAATESAPTALPAAAQANSGDAANTDDTIHSEVQSALWGSPALRDARIDVAVKNGIVTLTGRVSSTTAKELAVGLASSIAGVRRVFATLDLPDAATAPPVVTDEPTRPPTAPPAPTSGNLEKARQLMEEARREVDRGNHEAAARLFEQVLVLEPDNQNARNGLERSRDAGRRPPPPGGGQGPR